MNTFVENNKRFLTFYYRALRFSGWFLLFLGLCGYIFATLITMNIINYNITSIEKSSESLYGTTTTTVVTNDPSQKPLPGSDGYKYATQWRLHSKSLALILFGLLGIGISQLICYILTPESKPGFILKNGSKILYCYIIFSFCFLILHDGLLVKMLIFSDYKIWLSIFPTLAISLVFFIAKTLILVGLSELLKRLLPIIEESRTLV